MKHEHPGHFAVCLWLFLIWFTIYAAAGSIKNSIDRVVSAIERTNHAQPAFAGGTASSEATREPTGKLNGNDR